MPGPSCTTPHTADRSHRDHLDTFFQPTGPAVLCWFYQVTSHHIQCTHTAHHPRTAPRTRGRPGKPHPRALPRHPLERPRFQHRRLPPQNRPLRPRARPCRRPLQRADPPGSPQGLRGAAEAALRAAAGAGGRGGARCRAGRAPAGGPRGWGGPGPRRAAAPAGQGAAHAAASAHTHGVCVFSVYVFSVYDCGVAVVHGQATSCELQHCVVCVSTTCAVGSCSGACRPPPGPCVWGAGHRHAA